MAQISVNVALLVVTAMLLLMPNSAIADSKDGNDIRELSSSSRNRHGDETERRNGFTSSGLDNSTSAAPVQPTRSSSNPPNNASDASALAADVNVHESQCKSACNVLELGG